MGAAAGTTLRATISISFEEIDIIEKHSGRALLGPQASSPAGKVERFV